MVVVMPIKSLPRHNAMGLYIDYTVEPPNKGHVGDNINSAVVSFVERLSFLRRFKMY